LGRVGTALSGKGLAAFKKATLAEAANDADRIVAVSQWLFEALRRNGISRNRLEICRHGAGVEGADPRLLKVLRRESASLVLGFLGRISEAKGLDVLVRAVREIDDRVSPRLIVFGVEQNEADRVYAERVRALAGEDSRIVFMGDLALDKTPAFLASVDVLAVPSQVQETGPLVVLEAFAAGTPVLGSDLGGIRELVQDGKGGILVAHDDVGAWARAISELMGRPGMLAALERSIPDVRSEQDVVREMEVLYGKLIVEAAESGKAGTARA
jgi:glycosyltransferase involved in cell wall biosynthesis